MLVLVCSVFGYAESLLHGAWVYVVRKRVSMSVKIELLWGFWAVLLLVVEVPMLQQSRHLPRSEQINL